MRRGLIVSLLIVLASSLIFAQAKDPFGKYAKTVTATFAKATNAATDFPAGDSYANNVWTRSLLADLNLKLVLKYEALGGDKFETKTNLAIASNDLPDLVTMVNSTQFNKLVAAGRLEDLTRAFNDYASPLVKKWYAEDGGTRRDWGTVGGKLFGIAVDTVNYMSPRMIMIRADWRKELGLAAPKTMNDVIAMAKAFKAVDPSKRYGILITKDILNNGMSDMTAIANSMGVYPRAWLDDGKGNLVYGSVQPGMKEVLRLYRGFYQDGLINPEFATTDGGASAAQLTNSMVGVAPNSFWLPSWPLNSLYEEKGVDWECYPLMAMDGFKGKLVVQIDKANRTFYGVKKGFASPDALVKVMNYQSLKINDPVKADTAKFHSDAKYGYHMYMPFYPAFGPLFVNFDTNTNVTNAIDKNDEKLLVTAHDKLQYTGVKKFFDAQKAGQKPAAADWVAYKFFYGPTSAFGVLNGYIKAGMTWSSPANGIETTEMARKQSTLDKIEEQYYVEIITGKKPLEAFDQWVQDWKDLGGDLIQYEINEWYKTAKKK